MTWLSQFRFANVSLNKAGKWWQERQPREQALIAICWLVILGYGCYSLYKVYQREFVQMQIGLEEAQSDIIWLSEKQLELISLGKQGGAILDAKQVADVIQSSLVSTNTKNGSTMKNTQEGWQVQWQGSVPSHFMQALSSMSRSGALIQKLQLTRQGKNTIIKVTIN